MLQHQSDMYPALFLEYETRKVVDKVACEIPDGVFSSAPGAFLFSDQKGVNACMVVEKIKKGPPVPSRNALCFITFTQLVGNINAIHAMIVAIDEFGNRQKGSSISLKRNTRVLGIG